MTNLTTQSEHMALLEIQFDTQQLWQVEIRRPDDDKLVARRQVRLQNIDPEVA